VHYTKKSAPREEHPGRKTAYFWGKSSLEMGNGTQKDFTHDLPGVPHLVTKQLLRAANLSMTCETRRCLAAAQLKVSQDAA